VGVDRSEVRSSSKRSRPETVTSFPPAS
jgi:hypothetical protein